MAEDTFSCSSCGKSYRWKPELAGKSARCKCGEKMHVPERLEPAAPMAPPEASHLREPANPSCPSCGQPIKPQAVICISCGHNLQTGAVLETSVGRAVRQSSGPRQSRYAGSTDGFFGRLSRSWKFAKISYGVLWDFKQLLVFPIFSGAALLIVLLSFILPLWNTGTMEQFSALLDEEIPLSEVNPILYVLTFVFYFCNFFVIVFFNTALAACALKVCAGETPTIGYGLSIAVKRLPQIIGWALLSAVIGLLLKIIENAHEKIGAVIAAILGTAWSVLTYFVVPVLAVEGVGPFKALGRSTRTLKDTWGEALLGNFSMGLLTFLATLPLYLLMVLLIFLGISGDQPALIIVGFVGVISVALLSAVVSSAADMVFRSLLYNYATGRTIPAELDEEMFSAAFAPKS